jgi:peroxiredoxin Q/BCP
MNLLDWLGLTNPGKPLEIDDPAPDAVSRTSQDEEVHLRDLYGKGFTLVYFFPKADTPGCTAQACSLRDDFAELEAQGVRIIGVSVDDPRALGRFKQKFHLPFVLLSDRNRSLTRAFRVPLLFGMERRQSFLIHEERIVWTDRHASTRHQARDILEVLVRMKQPK